MFNAIMRYLSLLKSSFHDPRCCDETVTTVDSVPLAYRAQVGSLTCVLDAQGNRTGKVHVSVLEQYNVSTSVATGITKNNTASDSDFVADYIDTNRCPTQPDTPETLSCVITNNNHNTLLYGVIAGLYSFSVAFGTHTTISVPAGETTVEVTYTIVNGDTNYPSAGVEINYVNHDLVPGVGQSFNVVNVTTISFAP